MKDAGWSVIRAVLTNYDGWLTVIMHAVVYSKLCFHCLPTNMRAALRPKCVLSVTQCVVDILANVKPH